MTPETVLTVAQQALTVASMLAAPLLLGALATYRNCFDERRRPLRLDALRAPDATERFRTFYFTD